MVNNISYEMLIVEAVLRYQRIDNFDITILIDIIERDYGFLIEQTEFSNDSIVLVDDVYQISGKTEEEKAESRRKLFNLRGPEVKTIFDKLNYEEYVLRKIDSLAGISKEILSTYPIKFQNAVNMLLGSCLQTGWNDGDLPFDFEEVYVTQVGKLYLFLTENDFEVQEFKNLLKANNFNELMIVNFLKVQNLDEDVNEILTLERFIDFCNTYDRNPYSEAKPKILTDVKDNEVKLERPKSINEFLKKYPN